MISLQNLHSHSLIFLTHQKGKKVNRYPNLTPISTFDNLSKWHDADIYKNYKPFFKTRIEFRILIDLSSLFVLLTSCLTLILICRFMFTTIFWFFSLYRVLYILLLIWKKKSCGNLNDTPWMMTPICSILWYPADRT